MGAVGDGGGVQGRQQPGTGADDRAAADGHGRFEEFDGPAGTNGLDGDLALVESDAAEDVVADPGDHEIPRPRREVPFEGVRDEPGQRAEVLFVGAPRAPGVSRWFVGVFARPLVVALALGDACGHGIRLLEQGR